VRVTAQPKDKFEPWRYQADIPLPDDLFIPVDTLPRADDERRRHYQLAGLTVTVESDLPFADDTFSRKFETFRVADPSDDTIQFRHHFGLPGDVEGDFGIEIHRAVNWVISRRDGHYIYRGLMGPGRTLDRIAVFNDAHTRGRILNGPRLEEGFARGSQNALTLFPTDQVIIAPALADRDACYFHSSAVIMDGAGLVFVGHSEAGKSTILELLQNAAHPLCDDRNIIRRWPDGHRIHGSWSHGQVPIVSPASAPLRAVLLLEQSPHNRLTRVAPLDALPPLLGCVIKPAVTAEWWRKTLAVVEGIAVSVPIYRMEFDKSGDIVPVLREFCAREPERG
jgi:hypothetical protein